MAWILLGLDLVPAFVGRRLMGMRSTATILLLALALGLSAGPHPCHSRSSVPPDAAAAAAEPTVGTVAVSSTDPAGAPCHGGGHGGQLVAAPAPAARHDGHHATPVDDPPALVIPAPGSAPESGDCCGDGGAPSRCELACSSVAVLQAAAPASMGTALAALAASPAARPPASLAFPIDHVPLA